MKRGHLIDASCVTSQIVKALFVREFCVLTFYDYLKSYIPKWNLGIRYVVSAAMDCPSQQEETM